MAFLPAILSVVSGAISAVGAIQSANAQAAAAEYNAKVDERNARTANQDRINAVKTAQIEAEDKRRENRRTLASINAAYGATGLEMSGTPLDVLQDSAIELALDERRVESEGYARNREGGIKMQAFREDAVLRRMEAKSARAGGIISAFGYLIGGAGNALQRSA